MKMVRDEGLDEKTAGVTPAKNDKALKYMQTVPGMRVPDELIKRMEGAADKKAEGVDITAEMIQAISRRSRVWPGCSSWLVARNGVGPTEPSAMRASATRPSLRPR